jgi:hypothetical protein
MQTVSVTALLLSLLAALHSILPVCRARASSFFQNKANEIYDEFNAIILQSFSVRMATQRGSSFLIFCVCL